MRFVNAAGVARSRQRVLMEYTKLNHRFAGRR
jgi:hypothetical protein